MILLVIPVVALVPLGVFVVLVARRHDVLSLRLGRRLWVTFAQTDGSDAAGSSAPPCPCRRRNGSN